MTLFTRRLALAAAAGLLALVGAAEAKDWTKVRIGVEGAYPPFSLVGPGVQLVTATRPLTARDRVIAEAGARGPAAPYRTRAAPIRIGDRAWLGAGTIVFPGVTIGDEVTIGAGSLVTSDIPAGTLAFGQPCRVQRHL